MRPRFVLLAAAALALPLAAQAQESPAVSAAKAHFQSSARHASADLADLSVADAYLDPQTGATRVYLSQRHAGVDVYGTRTAAAVRDGRVFASGDAFEADLAARANGSTPSVSASAAAATAEAYAHARTPELDAHSGRYLTDNPALDAVEPATYEVHETQLVYAPVEGGALRLAWAVSLSGHGGPTGQQVWNVRVDAHTGAVLAADDLVAYDSFGAPPARTDFAPVALAASAPALGQRAGSYRVLPLPVESPTHGAFALVANPDDADASPFGWHDTNGAPGAEFTVTRGANVNAYRDQDNNNAPDPGSQPDGGAALVFDVPFDEAASATESTNPDAAVVNVFYWSNVVHDVLWHYGFDEPAGNFQTNNYGRGGFGNDAVRAEALDGSGTNNANFGTQNDGTPPRMQMFEWTGINVTATAPASIAQRYPAGAANFGPSESATYSGLVGLGTSPEDPDDDTACDGADSALVSGKIALIQRGSTDGTSCPFTNKVRNAQDAGAIAALIYNCVIGVPGCSETVNSDRAFGLGGSDPSITIPSAGIGRSVGLALKANVPQTEVTLDFPLTRDSDFDSGIIAHEIGHGVSTRLTGGPSASNCLSNAEQMGEGWSDYLGLMLTMTASDVGAQRRGVGTYVEYEDTDGGGIRPAPYSTDFGVNPATYSDIAGLSIPHGVGYVWASMLWDVSWALIDQDGFGDVYDAGGGFGNQKALRLVIEAMKLQPCSPGFVDGRDAILEADALLYGSAHSDLIGAAFAARGLGANASQGSSGSVTDGVEDFTPFPPFAVASETDALGRVTELAVAGQNPFRTETALSLSVATAQDVTVDVVDLLGRRVATLFSGAMRPASTERLTLSAAGLPSGVYVVRAVGETFSLSERVTLAR